MGKNPKIWMGVLKQNLNDVQRNGNYALKRLAVTEAGRVQIEAQKASYTENGYTQYVVICEPTACPICKPYDEEVFYTDKMVIGDNAPMFHPNCRCSTAAHSSRSELNKMFEDYEKTKLLKSGSAPIKLPIDPLANTSANSPAKTTVNRKSATTTVPKTLKNFSKYGEDWYKKNIRGIFTADEEKEINKVLSELIKNSELSMRFKSANLDSLLKDKRFKNQMETATSGGTVNKKFRKQATEQLFGTNISGLKAREYEKYGYLGNSDFYKDFSFNIQGGTGMYGDVIFRFDKQKLAN